MQHLKVRVQFIDVSLDHKIYLQHTSASLSMVVRGGTPVSPALSDWLFLSHTGDFTKPDSKYGSANDNK